MEQEKAELNLKSFKMGKAAGGLVIASFFFTMLQTAAYSPFSVQKGPAYVGARWAWLPCPPPSQSVSMRGAAVVVPFLHFVTVAVCCFVAVSHQREGWGLLGQEAHVSSMVVMWLEQGGRAVACIAGERRGQPSGASSWAVGESRTFRPPSTLVGPPCGA